MISRIARVLRIEGVFVKYGLDEMFFRGTRVDALRHLFLLSPTRWLNTEMRAKPRAERLRLALEELGPVFIKLGQMLSTRRDLLPDDIFQELALLQDKVKPYPGEDAQALIETALGDRIDNLFASFDITPMASASIAQVHAATLHSGESVVVKVLRPDIEELIKRDVAVMYTIAGLAQKLLSHGKRLRPVEVVSEYDVTIHNEVFHHNFFHADMHPGNIFVSPENPKHPQFIAVDFGIIGSLTDEDQRYIGENMLAFFDRDYRRVAQLHVDSAWVPRDTNVSELESAIRAVCEPIIDKPLAEISFGKVFMQLFQTAQRFEMEVQPQLVLLQKTLLNIEGLGRQLYPELDLWQTGKPFLQDWVLKRNDPRVIGKRLLTSLPEVLKLMPEMPQLVHTFLAEQGESGQRRREAEQAQLIAAQKSTRQTIVGGSVTIASAALSAGSMTAAGTAELPLLGCVGLLLGTFLLLKGLWQ